MASCIGCGLGLTASEEKTGVCYKCSQGNSDLAAAGRIEAASGRKERERKLASILLTTETVSPYPVAEYKDVITAECAFGMNVFKDLFAQVTDIVGGRSGVTQNILRESRKQALTELRAEAFELGANAVIGVSLSYSELSGGGKSMLFVVACGTAVVLDKNAVKAG